MTQIKICGLSSTETIKAAIDSGATHIGLVHFANSPRHVSLEQAAQLAAYAKPHVKTVLLLVNADIQTTAMAISDVAPDIIQFHGSETPEWLALVKQKTDIGIWKAIGLKDAGTLGRSEKYAAVADLLLFDAPATKLPGGNGMAADWSLLNGYAPAYQWGLAGGLDPDNVADAIRATGAPLVDISSGVESSPGVKNVDKIARFCEAVRHV